MLRLTTKVTVSPASSARSSSAATRIASTASGRVSRQQRRDLLVGERAAVAGALDRRADELGADREGRLLAARAAPRDERPVAGLHDVEDALGDPVGVEVPRVDAQALGQRHAVALQPLADLVGRGERVLGRDVVAVGAQPAQVGGAGGHELRPPVGEVRRDLHAHARQQPPRGDDEVLHLLQRDAGGPGRQVDGRPLAEAGPPEPPRGLVGDVGDLLAVVRVVRDEVLEDDLLQVAELGVDGRQRLERGDPVGVLLADPGQDAARERDPQLAGRPQAGQPRGGRLGRATPGGRRGRRARTRA